MILIVFRWMKWYGKKFRPFELHKGDFLDEKFRDLITKEATIILINNFAFTAELETRIKRFVQYFCLLIIMSFRCTLDLELYE